MTCPMSEEGLRRANYPILTHGGSDKNNSTGHPDVYRDPALWDATGWEVLGVGEAVGRALQ